MNLNTFVQTLTFEEREELLNILIEDSNNWTTQPPNIEWTTTTQSPQSKPTVSEDFTMNTGNSIKSTNKRTPVKAQKNTWSDTGEDRHIETPEITRTPRNRKPPAKKDVVCSACGKKDKVNSSLVYGEYYRCARCVGK